MSFDVLGIKIHAGVLGVDNLQNPQKGKNSQVNNLMRNKILHCGRCPRRNHLCKFWWQLVKGLPHVAEPNFALSGWLWSLSLQHFCCTAHHHPETSKPTADNKVQSNNVIHSRDVISLPVCPVYEKFLLAFCPEMQPYSVATDQCLTLQASRTSAGLYRLLSTFTSYTSKKYGLTGNFIAYWTVE